VGVKQLKATTNIRSPRERRSINRDTSRYAACELTSSAARLRDTSKPNLAIVLRSAVIQQVRRLVPIDELHARARPHYAWR